ncbi:hypothetical protein ES708_22802 [subsurface metagenome]
MIEERLVLVTTLFGTSGTSSFEFKLFLYNLVIYEEYPLSPVIKISKSPSLS